MKKITVKKLASTITAAAVALSGVLPAAEQWLFPLTAYAETAEIPEADEAATDITLTADTKYDDALVVAEDAETVLDLAGNTMSRELTEAASDGYVIAVYGKLTIKDSSSGKTGKISGGRCSGTGGGIYVAPGGVLILESGTITGNTALNGGGVYVEGEFTMTGGAITGNTAKNSGGGVHIGVMGEFTVTGGAINNNTAVYAGGVNVGTNATFTLGGDSASIVDITGNTASGRTCNVFLGTGRVITVAGGAASGSKVGVTVAAYPSAGSSTAITDACGGCSFLESDDADYRTKTEKGRVVIAAAPDNFTKLQRLIDTAESGDTLTLSTDFTYDEYDETEDIGSVEIPAGKTLTIDMSGHTIDRGLWDGKDGTASDDGCVIVNNGTLTIVGDGIITGGHSTGKGGGIYNTGTLRIEGCTVTLNRTVSDGNACGGGIYSTGSLVLDCAVVSDNTAESGKNAYGGGVWCSGGFDAQGTNVISGNKAHGKKAALGGGVYADNAVFGAAFSGSITGNKADADTAANGIGGGMYASSSTFVDLDAARITGNTASGTAGGIYPGASVTISGKTDISGNKAGAADSSLFLPLGMKIEFGDVCDAETKIGISVENPSDEDVVVTQNYKAKQGSTSPGELFASDDGYLVKTNKSGEVVFSRTPQYKALDDDTKPVIVILRGDVEVTGSPTASDVLKAVTDATDVEFSWYYGDAVSGTPIGTGETYALGTKDVGKSIVVVAKQTKDEDGNAPDPEVTRQSDPTAEITVHTHNFTYSVSGNVLKAVCKGSDCPIDGKTVTLTLTAEDCVFDGKTHPASLDIKDFNSLTGLSATASVTYNGLTAAPSGAGQYSVRAAISVSGRSYSLSAAFTIAKAVPDDVVYPKAKTGLVYNDGKELVLVTEGTSGQGAFIYRVGERGTWSSEPTATQPGTYTVYYYFLGDSDHSDIGSAEEPFSLEVTVDGSVIGEVRLSSYSKEYDGLPGEFTVTVKDGDGAELTEGKDYTVTVTDAAGAEVTECVKAGIYRVTVTGVGEYAGKATRSYTISGRLITDADGNAITGSPRYGDTLKATTVPADSETAYQWVRFIGDTAKEITGATAQTYIISTADDMDAEHGVRVTAGGNTYTLRTGHLTIKADNINGAVDPDSLVIVAASASTASDGSIKINGYTSEKPMEFSADSGKTWEPVKNGIISGLYHGSVVRIRYAGDNTHFPGETYTTSLPGAITLLGIKLTGKEIYGETLTAQPIPGHAAHFMYEWYRIDGENETLIEGEEGFEYTAAREDIGCRLKAVISDGMGRSFSASTTGTIGKIKLPAPVVSGSLKGSIDKGIITGLDSTKKYQYSSDGGANWTNVAEGSVSITGLTEGTYIIRERINDPEVMEAETAVVTLVIEVLYPEKPAGLSPIYVSASGAEDGGIRGVDTDMEYSLNGTDWTAVTLTKHDDGTMILAGLGAGVYKVRWSELKTDGKLIRANSEPAEVEIKVKASQPAPSGLTVDGVSDAAANDGKVSGLTDAMEYSFDGGKTWNAVQSGKTDLRGLSADTAVLVRLRETDTKLPGAVLDLGVIGYADRVFAVHYVASFGSRRMSETVKEGRYHTSDGNGISANAAFFDKAAEKFGLGTAAGSARIISYTITMRAVYNDGSPVISDETGEGLPDVIVTVPAENFKDNASGTAYTVPGEYNDIYVCADIGAYATDKNTDGVVITAPSAVIYSGLPHRLSDDAAALKDGANRSVSYDIDLRIVDTKVSGADDAYVLIPGRDFTVAYKNNINASVELDSGNYRPLDTTAAKTKSPQLIISGKGSYAGMKATVYFDILPLQLAQSNCAVGAFADGVPDSCTLGTNGVLNVSVAPARYARIYNKETNEFMTNTSARVNYVLGKDITAELERANEKTGKWDPLGDITSKTSRAAVFSKVTSTGTYRVVFSGIGNFCGTVRDTFTVEGQGRILFSSLKLKTVAHTYNRNGINADAFVKSISTKVNKLTVSLSDCDIRLAPASVSATVSADGKKAMTAGTYTVLLTAKDKNAFDKKYPGLAFDGAATASVTVKGAALTARMFSMNVSSSMMVYDGKSDDIIVTLNGISADEVTIAKPAAVNGKSGYTPFSDSELASRVSVSGSRLTITGGYIRKGRVTDSNAEKGTYSIAFYGRGAYADSVYVCTFKRTGARLTSSMIKAYDTQVNIGGTIPFVEIKSPDGETIDIYGSSADYSVVCKPSTEVGKAVVTVKVISGLTVFMKGESAQTTVNVTPSKVTEILPVSEFDSYSDGEVFLKIADTVQAGKKAPAVTLYQASADGRRLVALNKKDYTAKFTQGSDSKTFDLVITNGTSGRFDFGKGVTVKSAYVTYTTAVTAWTDIRVSSEAALIRDSGDLYVYTSEDIDLFSKATTTFTTSAKGKYTAVYAGGCYILPQVTSVTVGGKTLKYADGYYIVTYQNNSKTGTAKMTITLTQKAARELGIGGSKTLSFSIVSQSSEGLIL